MEWERLTGSHTVSPVSEVSPYTHRDAITHLEEIKNLNRWAHAEFERIEAKVDAEDNELATDIRNARAALELSISELDKKLTRMVEDSHDETLAYDPTSGIRTNGLSTVVSHVYDNARIYAYFAKELDDLGMTAEQYEDFTGTARHFDTAITHPTPHDVFKG